MRQTCVIPHVHRDCDGAIGVRRRDLLRHRIRGALVEIGDHDVCPFLYEPSRRRPPDPTAAADHEGDMTGNELGGALSRVLLVDLAALERPVLEGVHLRLRNELERFERFRIRDRLEHCPITQIGRDRAPLVVGRRDHPEPRGEHDLGPIVQRALLGAGVAPVIRLVLRALLRELRADRVAQPLGRRGRVEVEPHRQPPGPQDVLGRRHAATRQRGKPCGGEGREDVVTVVEMQDHAALGRRREHPAHDGEDELRAAAARLRVGDRTGGLSQQRAATSLRFEVVVDSTHDAHQMRVALLRILAPHHEAVMRQREAHRAARQPVQHPAHRVRQREPRTYVRHVHDL